MDVERLALLFTVGLFVGCSALTDFSPEKDDGAILPADDGGPPDDEGGEAGLYCYPGDDPCPAGSVFIQCGPALMGSDLGEGDGDEEPEHVVNVSAFCMDETEVTNRDYFACVTDGGCSMPHGSGSRTRPGAYYGNATYNGFPVLNVDWDQAAAYCAHRGKRLPTEAEWEKAARGGCEIVAPAGCGAEDERVYPWGDAEPTCSQANFVACVGDTEAVGAHAAGESPYGVQDLAGNVQEWVADWYAGAYYDTCRTGECIDPAGPPTGSDRTFRGGAWDSIAFYVRVANRFRQVGGYSSDNLGFRCVADAR